MFFGNIQDFEQCFCFWMCLQYIQNNAQNVWLISKIRTRVYSFQSQLWHFSTPALIVILNCFQLYFLQLFWYIQSQKGLPYTTFLLLQSHHQLICADLTSLSVCISWSVLTSWSILDCGAVGAAGSCNPILQDLLQSHSIWQDLLQFHLDLFWTVLLQTGH